MHIVFVSSDWSSHSNSVLLKILSMIILMISWGHLAVAAVASVAAVAVASAVAPSVAADIEHI